MVDIYFGASISGGRQLQPTYKILIDHIKSRGFNVPTEHVGDPNLTSGGEDLDDRVIRLRDKEIMANSKAAIFENSVISEGCGIETEWTEPYLIKGLSLYQPKVRNARLSGLIAGNPQITVRPYETVEEAKGYIDEFLESCGLWVRKSDPNLDFPCSCEQSLP